MNGEVIVYLLLTSLLHLVREERDGEAAEHEAARGGGRRRRSSAAAVRLGGDGGDGAAEVEGEVEEVGQLLRLDERDGPARSAWPRSAWPGGLSQSH